MKICAYGMTDKGMRRSRNEDSLFVDNLNRIYAVADGLGGLPRGALASSLAIRKLEELVLNPRFKRHIDYQKLFSEINMEVLSEGAKVSPEIGMGTTLTMAHINNDTLHIAHAGDSCLYLVRAGNIRKMTAEHTAAERERSRLPKEQHHTIPDYLSHELTCCIGLDENIKIDNSDVTLVRGDRLVICSDGVTKTLTDEQLCEIVKSEPTPDKCAHKIIDTGNANGGPDNITAIVIHCD